MPTSVVFLTHNYPRWPGDLAGAFLATLAAALVRRGMRVSVVAPSDRGQAGESAAEDGVRVRRVRYAAANREVLAYGGMDSAVRSPGGFIALTRMIQALRRAAREEVERGADLIHAHWWFPAALAAPAGVPLVITSHGSDAALLGRSPIARLLARPAYRRAAVVTAVSHEAAAWINAGAGRLIPLQRVRPMPVDIDRFVPSRGGGGAIVVGRLVPQKRTHLAIEAVARLRARGTTLPLTVVGDGPERPALERLAVERDVASTVRFVGAVAPAAVAAYLADADVMFFPASQEGFGLAAAEAFLAGVPVVACRDGGGVLDIVPEDGAGRRTLPVPEALADAALALIQSPTRAGDLHELRERWRERLSADSVAAACEEWYRDALASRRAA